MNVIKNAHRSNEVELDLEKVRGFRKLYQEMPVGQLLEIRESHRVEDYVPEARKALHEVLSLRKAELDREHRELGDEAQRDRESEKNSGDPLTLDTSSVFARTEQNSKGMAISAGRYNLIIGLVLCWGAFVNWVMVKAIPFETWSDVNSLAFLGFYFGSCYLGITLFTESAKPLVSFLGYNLVVVPFGAAVNMIIHSYDPSIVLETLKVTGSVIAAMMLLGWRFPAFFKKIETAFFVSLSLVVFWEIFDLWVSRIHHELIDWIVALIFCGYIGLDWGKANRIPKTVDNAIDSAAALYMDFINLFVRILRILGSKEERHGRS